MKRKLKAAASIVLAVSAGLFLACQRGAQELSRTIDAARGDEPDAEDARTQGPAIVVRDAAGAVVADASLDATKAPDALARRDTGTRDAAVDVNEHRKGMPVPDNLLE
ncbi:MAG TPA: hypothetical protein VF316_12675 [Polyangiaceae bacterium]